MEKNAEILNELRSISPLIAGIDKANVFAVPAGYFDSVSSTVLVCLSIEQGFAQQAEQNQSTDTPPGYFDNLADAVLARIKTGETATEEIRHLSPILYSIQNKDVFRVPERYFEELDKVLITALESNFLKEELKAIAPTLHSISGKHVFQVPDGYFSGLADKILAKLRQQPVKVVKMGRRRLFIKYAAAAMLTGITILGLYKYIDRFGTGPVANDQQAVAVMNASIEKGKNMNALQFDEALKNLKSADIANYLENEGDIADVAAIGNYIDDSNLPNQDDYFLDEATLDKYLKEIEKSTNN